MEKNYYVPILKWKRGEQKAIEHLDPQTKAKLLPLLEVPPIDWDWENDCPKKTIDEHIISIATSIENCFGTNPVFLDLFKIDDEDLLSDGTHSIEYIVSDALNHNLNIIPVISSTCSIDYTNAILSLIEDNKISELCIRIVENDFANLNVMLTNLLTQYNISSNKCHLIFDLKEKTQTNIATYQAFIPILVNNLVNLNDWITITLTATSFPETLEQVSKNSNKLLPRCEFNLWNTISTSTQSQLLRPIQFGDYCIANPVYSDVDPRVMGMSGNIRYTITNHFLIYKGTNAKRYTFAQMRGMCQQLISTSYYSGQAFSWGDKYIYDCANGTASTGNAETWRRVGTNHHIVFVVDQLSNISYF